MIILINILIIMLNLNIDSIQISSEKSNLVDTNQLINSQDTITYNNNKYFVFKADPKVKSIKMHWKNPENNKKYLNISTLKTQLEKSKKNIKMITNGGIFEKGYKPLGLYIENGMEVSPLNTDSNNYGNFYLQPNGVFYILKNEANVTTTHEFSELYKVNKSKIKYATQSGPMLVINGVINNKFNESSKNYNLRSGVGIKDCGEIVFIMSDSNNINLYEFASVFKNYFKCKNALYLDGAISKMYIPKLKTNDIEGNFSTFISVTN